MKKKLFTDRQAWRKWLEKNHDTETELWLVYYKKHTKKKSVKYDEAVEEALCYGWIDSTVRTIDEERYMQKYTPRKPGSIWSKLNKTRAEKMIEKGKMEAPGMEKIEEAKKNGKWDAAYTSLKEMDIPPELDAALEKNKKAKENFHAFANSYRNTYIHWITSAKRDETIEKRIRKVVGWAEENKKPGMM